jgi:hypothetical protein
VQTRSEHLPAERERGAGPAGRGKGADEGPIAVPEAHNVLVRNRAPAGGTLVLRALIYLPETDWIRLAVEVRGRSTGRSQRLFPSEIGGNKSAAIHILDTGATLGATRNYQLAISF